MGRLIHKHGVRNGWLGWSLGLAAFGSVAMALPRATLALTFPIQVKNFSGQTMLVTDEENSQVVAVPILNNGDLDVVHGVCVANINGVEVSPDAVAVTADGHFAYVHNEGGVEFYRINLHAIAADNSHVKEFDQNDIIWMDDGMTVLGSFVYALADADTTDALYKMAIDPMTGDLGSPIFVTNITDGMNTATGSNGRLITDGTCLYASNSSTNLIFQICGTTVVVWADAGNGGSAPGINGAEHTIVFGPNNANMFLIESNTVYSTAGLSGMTPGSFSQVGTLPGSGTENEGSVFLTLGGLKLLFAGNETEEEIYNAFVNGTGSGVTTTGGSSFDGEGGLGEFGNPGDLVGFDEAEGLAVLADSPRSQSGAALFANFTHPAPLVSTLGLSGITVVLLLLGAVSLRRRQSA